MRYHDADGDAHTNPHCYDCGQPCKLHWQPIERDVGIMEAYAYTDCCEATDFTDGPYFCFHCDQPCTGAQSERDSMCLACAWGWRCADCGAYHRDGDHGDEDESPCFPCAVKRGVAHG